MVLDTAWQIGKSSKKTGYLEQLQDSLARIEDVREEPIYLTLQFHFDEEEVEQQVISFAESFNIVPKPAIVKSFDLSIHRFNISEQVIGRRLNSEQVAKDAIALLRQGEYGQTLELEEEKLVPAYDAATIQAKTGLVSTTSTYAYAVNVNRDTNIDLICKNLNGLVLQPGDVFSFNGHIGERTAAKGYKEAGGILRGILVEELGGGICQPNTTLFHAVLKAGLEVVERHPHSWPSDYAPIGLDATVSWRGPDFKFRNNTNYPLAIVAWYDKPAINIQIYGLLLDDGVKITLDSEIFDYVPIPEPEIIEEYNEELEPGEEVEIRKPYIGRRTVAWRIWEKDDNVIKREEIFRSYYRPLQGIIQYGPTPTPTPEPTATPTPTPEPTPTPTPDSTPAPIPEPIPTHASEPNEENGN